MTEVVWGPGYMPGPVPVFQWQAEFEKLLALYDERKPGRVLEVGTYHGGTLSYWLTHAQPGAMVVSVDSYAVGVDNRHLYDDWTPEGVTLHAICGDSRDPAVIAAVAKHGPFDWVYIDAGHYYDEVRADWDNYGPLAAPDGVVVFHDILPPSAHHPEIEVERLWKQLKPDHETWEIVADPNAEWGGLGCLFMS